MAAYRRDLACFTAWLEVKNMDEAAQVLLGHGQGRANALGLAYKHHLAEEGLAAATINRRLAALRSMVEMANVLGIVGWDLKVNNLPSKKYRDTSGPGRDGVKKLLAKLDTRKDVAKTRRDRAIVRLLFGLALRRSEVVALDLSDVDFPRNRVRIRGKGRSEHEYMTMSTKVRKALADWIELRGGGPGALFVSQDPAGKGDGRLTGKSVHRMVRRLGHQCEIEVWPHGLRHAAITSALDATDGNVRAVQRFSRPAKVETVMVYDDNRQDRGGRVAELIDGMDDEPEDA